MYHYKFCLSHQWNLERDLRLSDAFAGPDVLDFSAETCKSDVKQVPMVFNKNKLISARAEIMIMTRNTRTTVKSTSEQ